MFDLNEPIVFVVEKPSVLKYIAPSLSAHWPGRTIFAIATMGLGLYEFRYPRGLRMADYPYLGEPAWRQREFEVEPVWEVKDGAAVHLPGSPEITLNLATSIVFAADPDARGAVAFHVLLAETLGTEAAEASWPAIPLVEFSSRGLDRSLARVGTTRDHWFKSARNAGLARRYFDYNFNINALAFFSPILYALDQEGERPSKSTVRAHAMSKFSLQLLYALRDRPLPEKPEGVLWDAYHAMQHWQGTGKYPPSPMGSASSQAEIVRGLHAAGLTRGMQLSDAGLAFLDRLHPDCCDPDLPARIRNWESAWPASKPSMKRYLRTFFGKQKRYAQVVRG